MKQAAALILVLSPTACDRGSVPVPVPAPVPELRPPESPLPQTVRVQVDLGDGPTHYAATPKRYRRSRLARSLAAALPKLPVSAPLDRLAQTLARRPEAAEHAMVIDGVAAWAGYAGAAPKVVVGEIAGTPCARPRGKTCRGALASFAAKVEPLTAGHVLGVGIATVAGRTSLVVATAPRTASLRPFARSAAVSDAVTVRGQLAPGLSGARLDVVDPDGAFKSPMVRGREPAFWADIECSKAGTYQVELMAEGRHGPEVVFNVPLYCGARPPTRVRVDVDAPPQDDARPRVAQSTMALVNEARARAGLPPLSWDDDAAAVAAGHATDMQRFGYLGHVSPRTGSVADRFARAGLRSAVVRENVALGPGPVALHYALMHSPSHRRNILADDVTHLGIGVVGEGGSYWLTQNFLKRDPA